MSIDRTSRQPSRQQAGRSIALGAALLLACAAGTARADVLVGPNGERLPGHVIEDKDGVLIFQSDFLGRITVQSDRARVERDAPPAAPEKAIAQTSQPAVSRPAAPRWSSDLEAKIGQDRGSLKTPESKVNAGWKLSRKSDVGEMNASVSYKYKNTDGELKDNDWLASVGYDRFLSADHFAAGRLLGVSELVSDGYNETATLALAWGWRFWEEPGKYLRIGPAIGYLTLKRSGQTFDGPAIGGYAHINYPLWGFAKFEGEFEGLNASAGSRYAISEIRLKRSLTERLYLALDWIYTMSRTPVETGVSSEWRWVIGWSFDPHPEKSPIIQTP